VKTGSLILIVLGISVLLGGWISNYASTDPDGLESVTQQVGIVSHDEPSTPWSSSLLIGVGGTLLVFGLGLFLGRIVQKRKPVS
jgi:hypothetical protein